MLRGLLKGLGALGLLLALAAAGVLCYRAWFQHQTTELLRIDSPNAIVEAQFVRIGGVDQWIQIRGENLSNPVILFLHGGPGFTAIPFFQRVMRGWERQYTVVHWDQRGAGKNYAQNGREQQAKPTLDQLVSDGIEVAEYLRHRLGQPKVILIGYSWGSVLGIELARQRPDLFYAFVGTGQVMDTAQSELMSYRGLLARARAADDKDSIATLAEIGEPPYSGYVELSKERAVLDRYPPPGEKDLNQAKVLFLAPGYSLRDDWEVYEDAPELTRDLLDVVLKYKVTDRGSTFAVPLFFFQGEDDLWTSTDVVRAYLPQITAPYKEIVLFANVGHHAVEVAGDRFLAELNSHVRPLTSTSPQATSP